MPFIIFITTILGVIFGFKKIKELSSDPHKDKDFFPDISNINVVDDNNELPFTQLGGTINDVSAVNRTKIYGIVNVTTEEDIKKALLYAKQNNLQVSIAGARHSMGGQTFAENVLVIDMKSYKNMSLDKENKILTVQSGAIWHNVQVYLSPFHLSVMAMQSIDVPTVGGTISVNAHGMDHRIGGIASTIQSLRLMLADGTVIKLSKTENKDLFRAAIGGYGLLGVILDVELELMDNLFYAEKQKIIKIHNFLHEFSLISDNKNIHMFYARLSTAPSSSLKEMVIYTFEIAQPTTQTPPHLTSESYIKLRRFVLNLGRKNKIGREIKWWGEKYIQPLLQSDASSRNQIMHRSYGYLKNNIKNNTDVLQEYFLPKETLLQFINELGKILNKYNVITRNVEIRCVYHQDILLDYARGDWFGVVLYVNFDVDEVEKIKQVHSKLIGVVQELGGSFYLPYMLSASKEQVEKSYPNFEKFIKLKQEFDPHELFINEFYKKYNG